MTSAYDGLALYVGDLHSHCDVGYGYGSVEDAYANARLQLDFASVTAHASWPDMPRGDPALTGTVEYHAHGFERAARLWPHLCEVTNASDQPGRFVAFPSFEWHSLRYGDHNVYLKDGRGDILRPATLEAMRASLRALRGRGIDTLLIPHHIGYLPGYRGISWEDFSEEFSPVVEMMSMHGQAGDDDAPYPYLHTMGPRSGRSTVRRGLALGKTFGLIGSTDHHAAHPGSYGRGRAAVWAAELTRAGLWEALLARRVYALTGDRIVLRVAVNGAPMGAVAPVAADRTIEVAVVGGAAVDYVEVVYNHETIHRWDPIGATSTDGEPVKVLLELGWGDRGIETAWDVELAVRGGTLVSVEPRLRGRDILSPGPGASVDAVCSAYAWQGGNTVRLTTKTWGNPSALVADTQGVCVEVQPARETVLEGRINGRPVSLSLADLGAGPCVGYLGGFLSPAYCFHRPVPRSAYACAFTVSHRVPAAAAGVYGVRVRQRNEQWAWSSPVWLR